MKIILLFLYTWAKDESAGTVMKIRPWNTSVQGAG